MQKFLVQCPGCKKIYHETTDKYDPNVRPNGAMVALLEPWKSWGWAAFDAEGAAVSTTLCSEMICPGCQAQLAPSGRLTVLAAVGAVPASYPPDIQENEAQVETAAPLTRAELRPKPPIADIPEKKPDDKQKIREKPKTHNKKTTGKDKKTNKKKEEKRENGEKRETKT